MKKVVTDEEIQRIYNDKDCRMLMFDAAKGFYKTLGKDEIEICKILAIFKSLESFDSSKGVKYETFLYKGVVLQCLTALTFLKKHWRNKNAKYEYDKSNSDSYINKDIESIEINECIKHIKDGDLLIKHYIEGNSITDIAKELNVSRQAISQKIAIAKKEFKQKYSV